MNPLRGRATNGRRIMETAMSNELGAQIWLGQAIIAAVPIYLVLQLLLAWAWRGGWRIAALAPLGIVLPAVALTTYGSVHGSNLAPLPLIAVAPFALAFLLIAIAVRTVRRPRAG